jgi:rubrerythrin
MNIYDFAMEKEKFARQYYQDLAQKAATDGLKNIFNMLADEELKHEQLIENMRSNDQHSVEESPVLKEAKQIFAKMKSGAEKFAFDGSERGLYEKAREIEANARDFYKAKAEEVDIEWQKDVFQKLADEEQKHYKLMDNLCSFVAKPETWLEDAEFYHLEDY